MDTVDKDFKRDSMQHLQELGLWDEARAYKEHLRLSGMDNEEAWREMDAEYQETPGQRFAHLDPDEQAELTALGKRLDEADVEANSSAVDKDMRWAGEHIRESVTPKDAPSPIAWNWHEFMGEIHCRFLGFPIKHEQEQESSGGDGWRTVDRQMRRAMRRVLDLVDAAVSDAWADE